MALTLSNNNGSIRQSRKTIIVLVATIIVAAIASTGLWWQRSQSKKSTTESSNIITRVSKHYVVPTNEAPTVAQIQNKESLQKDQEFYQGAENGDYVLVYSKAKFAILYRASIDKLLKVSPVTSNQPPQ